MDTIDEQDQKEANTLRTWPPIEISFDKICYTVETAKGKKNILNNVSGVFKSNELTAIIGGSGAGKSSLLHILSGLKEPSSGSINVNNFNRTGLNFRKMSRYIMQDDVFQKLLTVRETMMFATMLKLGYSVTKEQKNLIIEDILELLRLTKAGDTKASDLSGGELKRLSIALELVDNPPILFLDEPTTGLDDLSCSQCVKLLQKIAHSGRTVILSIHQPSATIFSLFDQVYALAEGHCVYRGNGSYEIIQYIEKIGLIIPKYHNPADFLIEVSSGEYGEQYVKKMICAQATDNVVDYSIDNLDQRKIMLKTKTFKNHSSGWEQFCILLKRNLTQILRNKSHLKLKLSMHILLGLLVGGTFFQIGHDASKSLYNFGFCFTVVIAFMYIPLMPVLLEFPSDVRLLKREHFNQYYKLAPYYFSLILARLPIQLGLGLLYLSMVFFLTGQPFEARRIAMFYSISILVFLVSESFGMVVASRLNILHAMFTGPVLLVPLMLLSVYNIGGGISNVPAYMRILMSTSYLRFGLEGIIDAVYGHSRTDMICPEDEVFCPYKKPGFLKKIMGFEDIDFRISFMALFGFYILFNVMAYFLLRQRISRHYNTFLFLKRIKNYIENRLSSTK